MKNSSQHPSILTCLVVPLPTAAFVLAAATVMAQPSDSRPMVYFCPDRPADQQFSATQEPGCVPAVDNPKEDDPERETVGDREEREVDTLHLQGEISRFLDRYNGYLACCSTDPYSLDELEELEAYANDLFKAVRAGVAVGQVKLRGVAYADMLRAISQAKRDLQQLKVRLTRLSDAMDQLNLMGYEAAGRQRERIRLEQEAIRREYRPISLPGSAPTGTEIGNTSLPTQIGEESSSTSIPNTTGQGIGKSERSQGATTGGGIGQNPATGRDIGQTPATGFGIGQDQGPTGSSSIPSRAGPSIGNSSLNK